MGLRWILKKGLDFDLQINLHFPPSRKENPSFLDLIKKIIIKRSVQGLHCIQLFHQNALTSLSQDNKAKKTKTKPIEVSLVTDLILFQCKRKILNA